VADVRTRNRRGRTAKNIKLPAKHESVEVNPVRKTIDGAEMKDLMTVSVAESELKLFDTAQTIAQQVQ